MLVVKRCGYVKALVDSTPPQRNMKSIDPPFASDSFKHKACDVSVSNLQSQYTFLYITLTCKEKEKRGKKKKKRFLSYWSEDRILL